MPTIEIASINSTELDLRQVDFEVAIIEENKLESHRGLFYDFLLKQKGRIIHIGNPDLKADKEGGFFAGQLVDWDFDYEANFQFRQEYRDDIKRLLQIAMTKSSDKKIYFLTDYQFGPELEEFKTIEGLTAFWEVQDKGGVRLNTLYEIK